MEFLLGAGALHAHPGGLVAGGGAAGAVTRAGASLGGHCRGAEET